MRTVERPRHYVSPPVLAVMRPLMRYSDSRQAYVLRFVGNRVGPVLRRNRRRRQRVFNGPDLRRSATQR